MSKDVTLHLDEFGQRALARFVRGRRASAAGAVRAASLYYLADRDAHRPAWRAPSFAREREPAPALRVRLDEDTWQALSEEAVRQGVSADSLAVHAVMYFLADLDSGRMAERLDDSLDEVE